MSALLSVLAGAAIALVVFGGWAIADRLMRPLENRARTQTMLELRREFMS